MAETEGNKKRKQSPADRGPPDNQKRSKGPQAWRKHVHSGKAFTQGTVIGSGDSGIFATCKKGKEAQCVTDLKDLFDEYAGKLYSEQLDQSRPRPAEDEVDFEAEIKKEVKDLEKPNQPPWFANVRLEVPCVVFLKTSKPVEPVSFVQAICKDMTETGTKRTRFVKRLTPMSFMGKATQSGLEEAATKALAPHFHQDGVEQKKFAIRPNIRNHSTILTKDSIIKHVAEIVGSQHKVDLKDFDSLILIEVYQNICGVSVVGREFEELRRFNLAEIIEPTSTSAAATI